jgi:sterol desaturase/sphingolipid hydroxylase (fatty acid hydroxylase superfamily)
VHHAAEVLTPMSAFRAHPIDIMIDFFFRLLCTGVVGGVYAYLYPGGITELTIMGFNAVAFVLYYWISHLQHSHVPLGYGRLSYLLVSPVMHQVHHSCEVQHWDRNFGFLFGLWDWMFRTIHVPRLDEPFRLGLPGGSEGYRTVRQLFFTPFAGAARRLLGRATPARSA